jgi:hypothetical protein
MERGKGVKKELLKNNRGQAAIKSNDMNIY